MRRRTSGIMLLATASAALVAGAVLGVRPGGARTVPAGAAQAASEAQTQAVATAASAFLDTLDAGQRALGRFEFPAPGPATAAGFKGGLNGRMTFVGERFGQSVWSNFPVSDVPRPGLPLGSLGAAQHDAALHLLQVLLSPGGYAKVLEVMGSDQALADGGTPFSSGAATYTLAILGTPGTVEPWMVQFGGHHLALNVVIAGARGVLAPALTGAQPASYTAGGRAVRVLARENDKAFALLHALDAGQRRQAVLAYRVPDLVLGPGHDGETIQPEGLKASAMTAAQRAMLLDLVGEWAGIVNDAYAAPRMAEIAAGLDDTYFAWSGPTGHEPGRNGTAYYRIQGPRLVIEFAPQEPGGDLTMHVHTVYRDPTNDYGRALTAR